MIAKLSLRIADFIRRNNDQAASMDVLMFSLTIVLNTLFITVVVLGIGLASGRFVEAATVFFGFVTLRFFSGGFHFPTSGMCNAISISLFTILTFLSIGYWNSGLILNLIALTLVLIFAPTKDIMLLNRFGPKYTLHFKILTALIVVGNFLIQSPFLALAFVAQALTLTPIAYKGVTLLERR